MRAVAAGDRSDRADLAPGRDRVGRIGARGLTLGSFAAGVAVLLIALIYPSQPRSTERLSGVSSGAGSIDGPHMHVNSLGGFTFELPAGWVVRDLGSASELTSPDSGIVVSFGTGRPGPLPDAASALLDSIRGSYRDVHVRAPERAHVADRAAVVVAGDLRNDAGVLVRFLGIATRVAGTNRVIAVFVSQPAPADLLPVVERVIETLEAA
jgi:hypothetical protein